MENGTAVHPQVRAWLERSVLQPYISEFCSRLRHSRYRALSIHGYLYCIAHFAHWARRHRLALAKIDERATSRFIAEHLPHCDCPYPVKRGKSDTAAAIRYASSRWQALTRYVDDGQLEIDNNAAERALRVVALGPKNSRDRLIAGDGRTTHGLLALATLEPTVKHDSAL